MNVKKQSQGVLYICQASELSHNFLEFSLTSRNIEHSKRVVDHEEQEA